jgi:hypothetical protein
LPDFFGDAENTFTWRNGNRFIHRRMMEPQVAQLFRAEQGDVGGGKLLAQAEQGGRGHHGVAQPVGAPHQNAARLAAGGWRMEGRVCHRLSSILHWRF